MKFFATHSRVDWVEERRVRSKTRSIACERLREDTYFCAYLRDLRVSLYLSPFSIVWHVLQRGFHVGVIECFERCTYFACECYHPVARTGTLSVRYGVARDLYFDKLVLFILSCCIISHSEHSAPAI